MKSIIKVLLLSVFTSVSYSQNVIENKVDDEIINTTALNEIVIKKAGQDYSIYVKDINVDPRVAKLQDAFVAYDLAKNLKDYDLVQNKEGYGSFQVLIELENGDGKLQATYNGKGKLITVVERYKNIQLPNSVCHQVYKEYPGWQIVEDKYKYSQEDGRNIKKEYKITMTKENKTKKIVVNPEGSFVAIR